MKKVNWYVVAILVAILIAGATIIITLFLTSGKPVMRHIYEEIDNSNI
jgi:hypothetical protein